tara:strand:- start:292 stop:1674 length:1383 start_codon:yes stop_codon:yes gene_type:complete
LQYTADRPFNTAPQVKNNVSDEWHEWIASNEDMDRTEMFSVLLGEGFNFMSISKTLNFVPTTNMEWLVNPVVITGESKPITIKGGTKIDSDKIEMWVLNNFLTDNECKLLIENIHTDMKPSGIDIPNPPKDVRTSKTNFSISETSAFGEHLEWRFCDLLGLDPRHAETMQGCHYEIGQEYKEHPDFFDPATSTCIGKLGQRSYTAMVYLNDVEEGGETVFPKCDISFKPKRGMAVIWNNLNLDGSVNHDSVHRANPVLKGTKTIITKWFRTKDGLPVFSHIKPHAPRYTDKGFKITALFDGQFKRVLEIYEANKKDEKPEPPRKAINSDSQIPSTLIPFTPEEGLEMSDMVQLRLEEWVGFKLKPTYQYGFRNYKHGTSLSIHRDTEDTHIIGVVINIAQNTNSDWALNMEDNYNHKHEILLQPQCMVFYEGSRLLHGRVQPLDGDSYVNLFLHFKPKEI